MRAPPGKAWVKVGGLRAFLRGLQQSLRGGGRWTTTDDGETVELREGQRERFPGQAVAGAGGVTVEPFWAGGPFEWRALSGRVEGSGWLCIRAEHTCVWEVGELDLIRTDSIVSMELVMLSALVDAVPATVTYVTSPELAITWQTPSSIAYWPLAYVTGSSVSHLFGAASAQVGAGVKLINPAVRMIDET